MPGGSPNCWIAKKNFATLITEFPVDFETLYIPRCYEAVFFEYGCNPKYYQRLLDLNLVDLEIVKKAENAISNSLSTSNDAKIEVLFRVGFDFGHRVLNHLWIPNARVQVVIQEHLKRDFDGYFVIGVQFRYEYLDKDEAETNHFLGCVAQAEADIVRSNQNMNKTVKWFLTADYENHLERLRKEYPGKVRSSLA